MHLRRNMYLLQNWFWRNVANSVCGPLSVITAPMVPKMASMGFNGNAVSDGARISDVARRESRKPSVHQFSGYILTPSCVLVRRFGRQVSEKGGNVTATTEQRRMRQTRASWVTNFNGML